MKHYFISEASWARLCELAHGSKPSHYINHNALDWVNQRMVIGDQALIELINARGNKPVDYIVWKATFAGWGRDPHGLVLYDEVQHQLAKWYLAQGLPRRSWKINRAGLAGDAIELIMRGWIDGV